MLTLDSSVLEIPKVGPKYAFLLKKLGIQTIEDLIYYAPFRYDDFSQIKKIAEIQPNETVTIEAIVTEITNIFTKTGKKLTKGKAVDISGELELIWFNQHYIANNIQKGKKYFLSGKANLFKKKLTLVSPDYEVAEGESLNTGRLVPIYSETQGISSKWLRIRINDVLNQILDTENIEENIPKKILNKYNLVDIKTALKQIHFPDNVHTANTAKNRMAFEELLLEMLRVEHRKAQHTSDVNSTKVDNQKFTNQYQNFIQSLPFVLTNSQDKAITEIFTDLAQNSPMNRLLEGDVGSGKTIVAVAAAYLSYLGGYKTLYMAPTEILAKQHYATFEKFLDGFVDKDSLKLRTGGKKDTNITGHTDDIVIGTHALLHEKEEIQNVGLVIIDEQHRFGVEQRAKLAGTQKKNFVPNMLTMTATPIPRTLALTLYGDLDISVLEETPNTNKKITTRVVPEKMRDKTFTWIKNQNEATFIVCPLIEESESEMFENVKAAKAEYESLKSGIFKGSKIGLLHGKMTSHEKEKTLSDFRNGKIKVLVSTPVIEVGVDIPDATVMVIESAQRYGLASLHQLRGRVGRGTKEGYCFIFSSAESQSSYSRLKNLEKISNGLKLAEIDLKYRGEGDIFGTQQHGFKKFKFATLHDTKMLETVKKEAESLYKELNDFPSLKEKVENTLYAAI